MNLWEWNRLHDEVEAEIEEMERRRPPTKVVRLPLAILPNKRVACCCTPTTCTCKKPVDKSKDPGKVSK